MFTERVLLLVGCRAGLGTRPARASRGHRPVIHRRRAPTVASLVLRPAGVVGELENFALVAFAVGRAPELKLATERLVEMYRFAESAQGVVPLNHSFIHSA